MEYERLYLFLEGDDDERFFEQILFPMFKDLYSDVRIWKYSKKTNNQRKRFIDTINKIGNWDYLCFRDINSAKCITQKKEKISDKFNRIIPEKIFIVIEEIESWYLAGITNDFLRSINSKPLDRSRNNITKEYFTSLIPNDMLRINFLQKILKNYEIDLAIKNNKSLAYLFMKKFSFRA